ncbi:MAG: hypothetical protein V3U76_17055 [Granulosicoccus sp.]
MNRINDKLYKSLPDRFCLEFSLPVLLLPTLLLGAGDATAADEVLKCRLYIAASMDIVATIELKDTEQVLNSMRRGSYCLFEDGSVADKQFVLSNRVLGDGATGAYSGFSVYTLENGDSISAQFTGAWDDKGNHGIYAILGGTGSYKDASGDGTITGAKSPWNTADIVDIVLNVTTP